MSIIDEPDARKPAVFLGSSREDIAAFPAEARRKAGKDIADVQAGRMPPDWKPMRGIGAGVSEIRVLGPRSFRILFLARFHEAVYSLHAFEKKSQATARRDIELGQARYQALLRDRAARGRGLDRPG
jgi:phage-related protein